MERHEGGGRPHEPLDSEKEMGWTSERNEWELAAGFLSLANEIGDTVEELLQRRDQGQLDYSERKKVVATLVDRIFSRSCDLLDLEKAVRDGAIDNRMEDIEKENMFLVSCERQEAIEHDRYLQKKKTKGKDLDHDT